MTGRACALLAGLWAATLAAAPPPLRVVFHHIHVNEINADHLLEYYGRLFDRSTTHEASIGDARGIEADGAFLLVTPVARAPEEEGGAEGDRALRPPRTVRNDGDRGA